MSIAKAGHAICTLDEWRRLAPPKSPEHWREFRSAMETARAWIESLPALPQEVEALLHSDVAFGPVLSWSAEPEARIRFDAYAGEPRNADLLVRVLDREGAFILALEGKADESFGGTVQGAIRAAAKRRAANPRSRGVERITDLCRSLFGTTVDEEPELGSLRYQLLTATAGTLAAAHAAGARRAVLLVHEFRSAHTHSTKLASNEKDLDFFIARLTRGVIPRMAASRLYALPTPPVAGRLAANVAPPGVVERVADVSLYLAKAVRHLPA